MNPEGVTEALVKQILRIVLHPERIQDPAVFALKVTLSMMPFLVLDIAVHRR